MTHRLLEREFREFAPWAAAALVLAIVLFHPAVFNDGDTYWHLATGDWILAHGRVPAADPFSYTRPGTGWVCHEWLSDLLLALAHRGAGWTGMALLAGTASAVAAYCFTRYLCRWFPALPAAVFTVAALCLVAPSLLVRPHVLALPMLVLWMIALLDARTQGRAPAWTVLPIMIVWANLHGSYVLGIAVTGFFAVEAVLAEASDRRGTLRAWALFLIATCVASLVSPLGFSGLLHPFSIMRLDTLPMLVEWRPLDLSRFQPLEVLVLAGAYFLVSRGIRLPPSRLLLLLATIHLAFVHARHGVLVCFVGLLAIAEPLARATADPVPSARAPRPGWMVAGLAMIAVLVAARFVSPIASIEGPSAPVTALSQVPPALAKQPVFNEYGFGGYLILSNVQPFIDGRADMYGDVFIKDYDDATQNSQKLTRILDRYAVQWTILRTRTRPAAIMAELPEWCAIYTDSLATVHARRSTGHCPS
ncbi:hypothetical protein [Emcibacter sp. SYSU 3D8]|uniref:hypothetical protein n=1 Tax=Emcibacter sp. SYSU 3D8 TaxID=3133969 RepID=UPI0031FE50F4